MPCTGCGNVFNHPKFFALNIWSMIDSQTPARGVEISSTPRMTSYTMRVHIMCLVFFYMFLVWLMPSGRATILEPMTAAHVHALHWMWQCLILFHILRRTHVEHDRPTDACTS